MDTEMNEEQLKQIERAGVILSYMPNLDNVEELAELIMEQSDVIVVSEIISMIIGDAMAYGYYT